MQKNQKQGNLPTFNSLFKLGIAFAMVILIGGKAKAQLKLGASIGLNFPTILSTDLTGFPQFRVAPAIGPAIRWIKGPGFSAESALLYKGKGGRFLSGYNSTTGEFEEFIAKIPSLEIPLLMNFHNLHLRDESHFLFGGYISFSMGGKYSDGSKIDFGNDRGEIKRLDYGLSGGYAFDFGDENPIAVRFLFSLGMRNLSNPLDGSYRPLEVSMVLSGFFFSPESLKLNR